jgi:competence protein ComEC
MYEWSENKLDSVKNFLKEYGKVTLIIFCIAISTLALYQIIFLSTERPLRVSFLDVGQGDAILIQTPGGRTMLIDGGASDVILARLSERLSFFTRDIDVMEETHPDADHVTGLIPVLEKYKINTMVLPPVKGETKVFSELEKHINEEGSEM